MIVGEKFRRTSVGSKLVKIFEQEAVDKDCKLFKLAIRHAADFI